MTGVSQGSLEHCGRTGTGLVFKNYFIIVGLV